MSDSDDLTDDEARELAGLSDALVLAARRKDEDAMWSAVERVLTSGPSYLPLLLEQWVYLLVDFAGRDADSRIAVVTPSAQSEDEHHRWVTAVTSWIEVTKELDGDSDVSNAISAWLLTHPTDHDRIGIVVTLAASLGRGLPEPALPEHYGLVKILSQIASTGTSDPQMFSKTLRVISEMWRDRVFVIRLVDRYFDNLDRRREAIAVAARIASLITIQQLTPTALSARDTLEQQSPARITPSDFGHPDDQLGALTARIVQRATADFVRNIPGASHFVADAVGKRHATWADAAQFIEDTARFVEHATVTQPGAIHPELDAYAPSKEDAGSVLIYLAHWISDQILRISPAYR